MTTEELNIALEELNAKTRKRVALAIEREEVRTGKEVFKIFRQYPSAETLIQWKKEIERYHHVMEVLFEMNDEIILQIEPIDNDKWQGYLIITSKQEIEIKIESCDYKSCETDKTNYKEYLGAKLLEFGITDYKENTGFYQWIKETWNLNIDVPAKFLTLLTDKGRLAVAVYNTESYLRDVEINSWREHVQFNGAI